MTDQPTRDYGDMTASFVTAVRAQVKAEQERDAARATIARIEALAGAVVRAWDDAAPTEPCDDCQRSGVALWSFDDDAAMDALMDTLRAALDGSDR